MKHGEPEVSFIGQMRQRLGNKSADVRQWVETQRPRRPAVDFVFLFFDRDGTAAGEMLGGAVAFRFFMFIVPVALMMVGALGFASGAITAEDAAEVTGISGALRAQVQSALSQSQSTRWVALFVGFWGSAWTGWNLAKTLGAVSGFAWAVPVRKATTSKALLAIVGVLVTVFVTAAAIGRIRATNGVAVATVGFGVVTLVYLGGWFVVSLLLPRATRDPSAVLPGAALMAVSTSAVQWLSQIWLPDRFSKASELYGAVGTTAVTLGFFFLIGRLFVWSMVLNAVTWERFGTISTLVFSLPVLRRMPRRFPSVARFFGLDDDGVDGDDQGSRATPPR